MHGRSWGHPGVLDNLYIVRRRNITRALTDAKEWCFGYPSRGLFRTEGFAAMAPILPSAITAPYLPPRSTGI